MVKLTLLNTLDNSVSLSCSVQPKQTGWPTCTFSPNPAVFDGRGNATAQLTVSTGTTAASVAGTPDEKESRPLLFLWLPVAGLALVGT
jgi:hypothetical protein